MIYLGRLKPHRSSPKSTMPQLSATTSTPYKNKQQQQAIEFALLKKHKKAQL